jgi:hypothetical protein
MRSSHLLPHLTPFSFSKSFKGKDDADDQEEALRELASAKDAATAAAEASEHKFRETAKLKVHQ